MSYLYRMTSFATQFTTYDAAVMARLSYEKSEAISFFGGTSELISIPSSDTQILCCTFEINGTKASCLVNRGSESPRDWFIDLAMFNPCRYVAGKVHPGALMAWQTARSEVLDWLRAQDADEIFCIGHSLGGQLTSPQEEDIRYQLQRSVTRVTFGAPAFGNAAYCRYRNDRAHKPHYRYVSGLDFAACSIVHAVLGYRHDSPEIRLGGWRRYGAHKMSNYEKLLEKEPRLCLLS